MDCQYEWTQWETHGGTRTIRATSNINHHIIKYEKPVTGLGEKETAIIAFGRETFGQRQVSSETFAEVLRLFGRKGTLDLIELMAGYSAAAAELTAFDNHLKPDQKPLLPPAAHPRNPERFAAAVATRFPTTYIRTPEIACHCRTAKT